jgi:hypothetical protein
MTYEWVLYHDNLEAFDVRLYGHLARMCGRRGWCHARQAEDLAAPFGVSTDTVQRSLRRLVDARAVDVADRICDGRKRDAVYRVAVDNPAAWADWPEPTDWSLVVRNPGRTAVSSNRRPYLLIS